MKLLHSLFLVSVLFLATSISTSAIAAKININTASAELIASTMTGVGDSKAQAIINYRTSHGKFKSIQDLENVDGIGLKTVEKNKDKITL
ncbi:MAG: ComEA family DNA-binding protein [Gammaproteobacteria bacterium]|nr:ComEA family DNA-binding protein [Gammaproteobacteria bacterium]